MYQLLTHIKSNQLLIIKHIEAKKRTEKIQQKKPTLFTESKDALGIDFYHRENSFVDFKLQPTLPHMHSRNGPGITVGDVNGDQLEDFYIGGAAGFSGGLYIQNTDGRFNRHLSSGLDSLAEDMGVLFFDADSDDDQDLYISSGGTEQVTDSDLYQDRLLLNDSHGNFSRSLNALPVENSSGSCTVAADYDRDGDLDLFIGGRVSPGKYPLPAASFLFRNDTQKGTVKFVDVSQALIPRLNELGMVCAALWSDIDNDGWMDLMVTGEFLPIRIYKNNKGKFESPLDITNSNGWWNSLLADDFDLDGDMDYLAGNLGLNSHFKATPKEPLCINAKDFNSDGRIDPIMSYYIQGVKHVGHPRDILIDQINTMRRRFKTYSEYANSTFEQSFLPEELQDSYEVCVQTFESSYIENLGNGNFRIKPLPLQAQFAPIYGMIADDYDSDGIPDVLISGNSYSPEVISGRDDASIGLLLKGDGKGNFNPVSPVQSGFLSDLDSKGMVKLILENGQSLILVGNNSNRVKLFKRRDSKDYIKTKPDDSYAIVTLTDGRSYRHEFQYGSTYLSNSSRSITLSPKITSVSVFDFKGNKRLIQLK
jgi:hypothetical protein